MAILCGMPTIQYSARRARLSGRKLFASCIQRDLVSRDSIVNGVWLPMRLSDVSVIYAVLSTLVGRRRKFGEVSYTECIGQGNDLELIPMIETETRNHVEGYCG